MVWADRRPRLPWLEEFAWRGHRPAEVRAGHNVGLYGDHVIGLGLFRSLPVLIQQTEEAYGAGDIRKAEDFEIKYKEVVTDLMKGNSQPDRDSRNFEFCRFCGESVPLESTFCSKCGGKLR